MKHVQFCHQCVSDQGNVVSLKQARNRRTNRIPLAGAMFAMGRETPASQIAADVKSVFYSPWKRKSRQS